MKKQEQEDNRLPSSIHIDSHVESMLSDPVLAARLARDGGVPPPDLPEAVREYLRFLVLAANGGASPSAAVDRVWHVHLLFTRGYEALCRSLVGRIVHHEPHGPGTEDVGREAYARTLERYEEAFGPPPSRFWPPASPPALSEAPASGSSPTFGALLALLPIATVLWMAAPHGTRPAVLVAIGAVVLLAVVAAVIATLGAAPPARAATAVLGAARSEKRRKDDSSSSCGGTAATGASGTGSCGDGGGDGGGCGGCGGD